MLTLFPFASAVFIIILLIISWKKRHWFFTEAGQENPYKTVFEVINFARKHKYPLQRSAFTYSDKYIPSRVDFAKERYGGPFTTEQVENVKTFFRILIVLFAMGPLYTLEVPASYFIFPLFGFHTLQHNIHLRRDKEFCIGQHTILGITLMYILSTLVLFPIYIMCITHSVLRKKVLKLFKRISSGAILCLLGVSSLVFIDVVGHSLKKINISNHTQCMFQLYVTSNDTLLYPTLDMHWSVLIPPSFFLGVDKNCDQPPLLKYIVSKEFLASLIAQICLMPGYRDNSSRLGINSDMPTAMTTITDKTDHILTFAHVYIEFNFYTCRDQPFHCHLCSYILRDPHTVSCCKENFCKSCIMKVKEDHGRCPKCGSLPQDFVHFPNKKLGELILQFEVYCMNECNWKGVLEQHNKHLNVNPSDQMWLEGCGLLQVECIHCKLEIHERSWLLNRLASGIETHAVYIITVSEAYTEWQNIGLELGLEQPTFNSIKALYPRFKTEKDCYHDMLKKWSQSNIHANYKKLLKVFRSKTLKLETLAKKIETGNNI